MVGERIESWAGGATVLPSNGVHKDVLASDKRICAGHEMLQEVFILGNVKRLVPDYSKIRINTCPNRTTSSYFQICRAPRYAALGLMLCRRLRSPMAELGICVRTGVLRLLIRMNRVRIRDQSTLAAQGDLHYAKR